MFLVTFPDLPEAATEGATIAGALRKAGEALSKALAGRKSRGEPIPTPSVPRAGQFYVRPAV